MALSEAMRKRIKQNIEKKTGGSVNSSAEPSSTQESSVKPSSSLSSAMQERIRKNIALKRLGREDTGVDEDFIRKFQNDYQKFVYDSQYEWKNMTYQSSRDDSYAKRREDTERDLSDRATAIRTYLDLNKGNIDDEAYKSLSDYMDQFDVNRAGIMHNFTAMKSYYSQWETEDDYNAYVAQQKDYEEKSQFDIDAGQKEIEHLESVLDDYKMLTRFTTDEKGAQRAAQIRKQYGGEKEIKDLISQKKQYLNQAKHIQEGITLSSVSGNADFKDNSGYVSTEYGDGFSLGKIFNNDYNLGYKDLTYEYINNQDGIRDEIKQKHRTYSSDNAFDDGESTYEEKGYDYLTENEVAIYNYYYAKEGKDKAQEYLDSIQESLNLRKATGMYENMEGNTLLELAFGVAAGLDQFESGVKNLFNTEDDYIPQSSTQMASGMVREDLADVGPNLPGWLGGGSLGQMGYDAVTTTANMAPSIMTSMVANMIAPGSGAFVGNAMMFASSAGNAYQEALNLGYEKDQARAYSILVGGSEAGLQYLLGGIGSLGGKVSGNVLTKVLNGVDNAFARTAIKLGGNMLSEGIEEGLQEILTPWFQNLALHTDEDINWSEVAYSTLLGALTAGFMEGGSTISGEVNNYRTGKQLQEADISAKRLSEIGNTFAADTVAHQLAGRVDENTGAYTMGRLFNEIGATLTEQNVNDITQALVAKGMTEDTARANAKAMASVVEGGNLTDTQVKIIEANEVLAEAVRTTIIDSNATWFQRTKGYNDALMALAQEKAAPKASRTEQTLPGQENAGVSDKVDTQKETGSEVDTSPAKVKGISSIEDGQVTISLEDDSEVNVRDADLDPDDGVRIETIASIDGISAADANFILNTLRVSPGASAQMDSLGAKEAYKYGFYGFSQEHITKHGVFANSLTETQRQTIYEVGQRARQQVAAKQATVAKNATTAEKSSVTGKVHFDGDRSVLTERQSASLTAMEKIAEALGVQVYVFESQVGENGNRIGANGWYDPKDSSIHIDLHAGANGEGTMLFTLAHELAHHIRKWSPAKFKTLADFLMQEYGKKGVNVDALVREQMAKAKRNGRTLSYDTAYEEVVADSMETMLSDGKVMEKLEKLKQKDQSLWQKIKDFISELAAKIRAVYDGLSPDSVEGRYVAEMKDAIEHLQDLFTEGLVEASENYQASEQVLAEAGIAVSSETDSGSLLSVRDVLSDADRKKVAKALAERFQVTEKEAMKWLTAETSLASLILNPKYSAFLDYEADPGETAIKQNSDYPQGTVDFSNICKKRREFTQVMNRILRNFPNHVFAATDLAKIRTIMGEEGMTLPCGICYVEDRRQLDTIVAQDFIDGLKLYREGSKTRPDGKPFNAIQLKGLHLTDGDTYVPTIYELVSLEGRNSLKAKNPNMEAAWVKYNNARGMNSVRLLTNEAEYKRQILKYSKKTVQSKNDHGGLRIYSFSDAEMFHLIDIIQVITDSAAVGLSLQGYTKVNEYAKAVKDTGEKLNRSLIPKGDRGYHVENGKVVLDYDTVEGIDITSKDFFDNKDNPNVGNITIGVNDIQIRAAMVSDFVDQIIPFHTGQSGEVLGEKGIAAWKNYKDFQTEKDIATGKTSSHQVNIYTEVFQAAEKEGNPIQNKRQFVEKFLQVCKENNLQPRFSDFLNTDAQGNYIYTEGYHKFLVDFKTFAQTEVGEYLPQMPVKPIFDNAYITGLLTDYVKQQQTKDAEVAKNMPRVIERITNEIIKPEEVKYSDRDSDGNQLSEEQQEFFKDSKARDKKGNLLRLYHGSNYQVTKFNPMFSDDKTSLFMTDKFDVAASYSRKYRELNPYEYIDENSTGAELVEAANKFVFGKYNLKAISRADIAAASDRVIPKLPSIIGKLNSISEQLNNSHVKNTFGARGHGRNMYVAMETLGSNPTGKEYEKLLSKMIGNSPWLSMVADNLESFLAYDSFGFVHSDIETVVEEIRELRADAELLNARDSGDRAVFRYEDNFGRESYISETMLRKEINWATSGGILPVYANITNPFIVDAKGRRWNNIKVPEEMREFHGADIANTRSVAAYAKAHGYDGVIFKGLVDMGGYSEQKSQRSTVVIAFEGTQMKSTMNKNPTSDPDIRYSTREYAKQVDEVKNNTHDRKNHVYMGTTPTGIAKIIDLPKLPMLVTAQHIYSISVSEKQAKAEGRYNSRMNYHDLGWDAVKKLPEYINKPVLIIKSNTDPTDATFVVVTGYADKAGNPIIVAVKPNGKGKYFNIEIPTNIMLSGYGKNGIQNFVARAKNENRILYANKNSQKNKANPSVQFADVLLSSDYTTNLAEFKSIVNSKFAGTIFENSGLPKLSDRDTESVSNRSLLANAFEGVAQSDIERNKIQEYKGKISLINAEERKLRELREQIKELSFAKGPKDTKKIRDLQFEANQTANRISTYDKQLLRLEASQPLQNVLNREKEMARKRAEQKGKEALAAYREKATKTQKELLAKWQDSRKKGIENRHRTEMRHKIKGVVNELNQYLLQGNKDKRVMMSLKKAVAEALDAVNMDTVGAEERIAKLQAEMMRAKTPEQIQEISRKIDHIQQMGDRMSNRLKTLKDAYREIAESDDPLIANAHDEVIEAKMESVIEKVGNTPLRDMNLEQLNEVYDMYRMVLTTVRNSNKAFKAAKSESIATLGNRVMMEVEQVGGKKKYNLAAVEAIKKFGWNNLKPVYAFEHIGSSTLTEIFNNVRTGEDVWAQDVTEARAFYLDKSKKYKYDSWDFQKQFRFTSTSGMDFSLSLEQIMSLYAYSKREQAADHLKRGGIVFDETTEVTMKTKMGFKVKFNPTEATAYNISEETLADITSKLTDEQKGFVDEMQEYLSSTMGEKGNEVSLELYGIKLFKEKFYFPLKSASQFMAKAKEQQQGEVKIKNSGFSKETVKKASNPIVLTPFMNVWANHVNEMSMYHAFVLPMEDFYRVYNYRTPTSDSMATESVEMFIQNAYGKGATKYIDQLLKDLNGGARTDSTTGIINKGMGLFKKGAVFASLSVVIQQPSAIARAAALVETKYFIGPKVDHKRHKLLWNEVKQYAPVAIIKEMGYFDTNMGKSTQDFILGKEYSGLKDKMTALVKDSNYRDEILSKAPALADEIAWCSIWEAVKRETRAKNPGMEIGSDAFLKKAGERFTEVIVKTQVYDSVLARSANMRSKDTGMKMATAFMAEPTTSINMVADALLKGKRGNRKYARATIGAVIASQILNSILVSFVYAGRDDDEDETYWEKYIGTLSGEILDSLNPAGYIPFIKDIMSIVQGYDVERSDMAVVSDLWNAWQKLGSDDLSVYRKVEGFVGSICQIFGLPVKNIMRGARAFWQTIIQPVIDKANGVEREKMTKAGIGYAVKSTAPKWLGGGDVSNQQQLYEAYLNGDTAQIARVKSRYKDQSTVNSALRKALRENDPRIREAAIAWNANDLAEYKRIAKEIIAEKHFVQDDVVLAIRAEANELAPDEGTTSTGKAKGLFTAEKFAAAISQGDQAMANAVKVDIIQTEQKNGKTAEEAEKSFNDAAKTKLKELFLAGEISEQKAINALTTCCGADENGAMADVQYWAFKQDYPDVYAEDSWFDSYYEKVADSGLGIDVYMEYRNMVAGITGEDKKERRMDAIDSLPITSEQKDALYFAEGWAASKLYEAPWH